MPTNTPKTAPTPPTLPPSAWPEPPALELPDVPDVPVEAVASHEAAAVAQRALLAQIPVSQEPVVSAANGYTKTRLGTLTVIGNVGASRNIAYKTVGGRDLVEFSFAARTIGSEAPTWYRVTLWEGDEAARDLVRQGTYLQIKGLAVQSQSHRTGKVFLDLTAQRLAEGPAKGEGLSVAGSRPAGGYFARLFRALLGR